MATSASAEKAATEARDFTKYADKPPTDLQSRFSAWILTVTGYEPDDMDSFNEGVRLATALRMAFQASPENQEALEARREEAAAKKSAPKKAKAKAEKKPAKVSNPKPEDVEAEEEDEEAEDVADEEAEETPAPVKRKPGKRVKAAPKAESDDEDEDETEAPF
jgi:hypothetical protein